MPTAQNAADRFVTTGNRIFAPSPVANPPARSNSGGMLGDDGFLTKAGETAIDLLGLFGREAIRSEFEVGNSDNRDPAQEQSEQRAGILPETVRFVLDNRVPIYVVGGIAAVGVIAAIVIASNKK